LIKQIDKALGAFFRNEVYLKVIVSNNRKNNAKKCAPLQVAFILNFSSQIIEMLKTEPWESPVIK